MTVVMVSEDPIVQAENALVALQDAVASLSSQLLTSSHAGTDKRTLETSLSLARQNYDILREMFRQMQGLSWDTSVISINWFENSERGWEFFKELFNDTRRNIEAALNYSMKVNLSGRFVRGANMTKETAEDVAPSAPVAYGLIAIVAIAVIAIVVLR